MGFATYFASKSRHAPFLGGLVAAGVPLTSDWWSWGPNNERTEPTPEQWRTHSERCLSQAASSDIVLLYYESTARQFGSLLEAGACLGAGGYCYLVSDVPLPFLEHHPHTRRFPDLASAIRSICSQRDASMARVAA
jgi:hypothetical protein